MTFRARVAAGVLLRSCWRRLELRQPNLRRLLFEHDGNFHAEFYIFDIAADHIRDHAWPFFEIDPGDDIGDVGFKGLRCRAADHLTDDCKGIDFTLAAHRRPLDALATALEARRPWRPDPSATILATLHDKFLLRRGVPEGFSLGGNSRQRLAEVYFGHR